MTYPPPAPQSGFGYYSQPAPQPKRRMSTRAKTLLTIGIVLVSGGLVTGIVIGAVALTERITESLEELTPSVFPGEVEQPLIAGEPGSPLAEDPTECPTECFTAGHVTATIADRDHREPMGLTYTIDAWGAFLDSTVALEYESVEDTWTQGRGSPVECFFSMFSAPAVLPFGTAPPESTDTIHYTGTYGDKDQWSILSQSVRVFPDSSQAVGHMVALDEQISGCPTYGIHNGGSSWSADLTAAPALELPASVAAVGWVESSEYGRFYVFDVQRGNMVVRTTLNTSIAVSEEQFRTFIGTLADELAAVEPRTPVE